MSLLQSGMDLGEARGAIALPKIGKLNEVLYKFCLILSNFY